MPPQNDCAPEFKRPAENNTLQLQFSALHLNPGDTVYQVQATDRDLIGQSTSLSTPTSAGRLSYALRQLRPAASSGAGAGLAASAPKSAAASAQASAEALFTMNASSGELVVARRPTSSDAGPNIWLVEVTDGLHLASIYFQVCSCSLRSN